MVLEVSEMRTIGMTEEIDGKYKVPQAQTAQTGVVPTGVGSGPQIPWTAHDVVTAVRFCHPCVLFGHVGAVCADLVRCVLDLIRVELWTALLARSRVIEALAL